MISTPLQSKLVFPARSGSQPSRSHPLILHINDLLQNLNASSPSYSCCRCPVSSLSSITMKLHDLENLYDCVDDLLLLPHTGQVFAREFQEKWVQQTLDGYLGLVDACATAKDFTLHTRAFLQDLLSALRRRPDSDDQICGFVTSRKIAKKMIHKCLRCIIASKNKPVGIFALDKDHETIAIISMLKITEATTMDLIEALLMNLAGRSRPNGWSFVSKLMHYSHRKFSGHHHRDTLTLELGELDAMLYKLAGFRPSKCDTRMLVDELQQQLRGMDSNIQVVEETLDCLFKRLVRTRVQLLNLQSQQ